MRFWKTFGIAIMAAGMLAGTAFAVELQDEELSVMDVKATSELAPGEDKNYYACNLIDNDVTTAWAEDAEEDGIGESFTFTLQPDAVLTGFSIVDGCCESEELFYENSAPSIITCHVNGESYTIVLTTFAMDYIKASEGTEFVFKKPIPTGGEVTFSIDAVRSGNTNTDTCISELHLYGYEDAAQTELETETQD